MKKKYLVFLFLFLLSYNSIFSQNDLKNWYFGTGTDGITFVNNIPQKLNNKHSGVGFEGMVVVNNPTTGELLFYSNGQDIINKNHTVMSNGAGMTGHTSGAQCVQSCPVPGSCYKKFYIFTNSAFDLTAGVISYSIIDFVADPNGTVTNKNTPVVGSPASDEAMCLINKPNSTDYWLIVNKYQTAEYYVWPITSSGIGTPVTYSFSITGSSYQMSYSNAARKIVVTGYGDKHITTLNFNAATGILSNEVQLGNSFGNCQSARFSPDGSKLYAATTPPGSAQTTPAKLYQYDYSTTTWTDMSAPPIRACCYAHDLKMGPDGKMYHIHTYNSPQPIAVIDFPDRSAVENPCNYHTITFPSDFNGEVRRFPETVVLPVSPIANTDVINLSGSSINIPVLANDVHPINLPFELDAIISSPAYGSAIKNGNTIDYISSQPGSL